jgi:membrane protease YdiL (CAAX protease family)
VSDESGSGRVFGLGHPLARSLIYLGAAYVAMSLAAAAALSIQALFTAGREGARSLAERVLENPSGTDLVVLQMLAAPVAWIWTYFFRRKIDGRSFRALGLDTGNARPALLRSWIWGLLVPGLVLLAGLAAGFYRLSPDLGRPGSATGQLGIILLFLPGFLVEGATEELMIRGYVQRTMMEWRAERGGLFWILVVPAILFSLSHMANPDFGAVPFLNTVLIGILLGALVLRSGRLWSAIGLHAGWNFGLACVWSLPVSGLETPSFLRVELVEGARPEAARLILGGGYGPEGGLAVTLLVILALSWVLPRAVEAGDRHPEDAAGVRTP